MRNARAVVIVIVIVLVAALVVYLSVRKKPLDVTGNYRVKVNGELTKTTAMITGDDTGFTLSMSGENELHNTFEMTKTEDNEFTVLAYAGVNKITEYRLRVSKKGLEGTAWVLPVGKIDVVFEKVRG
jgi:hypothetical protein